jgi:hypothetical protein
MIGPTKITFTGIDPTCSWAEIYSLLGADPRVELGFLYSMSREGAGRYPPLDWIRETAWRIFDAYGADRAALHVCGRAREDLIRGKGLVFTTTAFNRLQLNGAFLGEQIGYLRRFIGEGEAFPVITQFDSNPGLHDIIRRPAHQVLFDASGGRGILRKEWPKALPDHVCGYAGGLGPDNLRAELPRIAAVAGLAYWVDMEGSLRDENDHFSVERARLALMAIWHAEGFPSESETAVSPEKL